MNNSITDPANNITNNITNNIAIFGASGHAKVVADIIILEGKYNIKGIISPKHEVVFGLDYLGADADIIELVKKHNLIGGIIAIGDNNIRKSIAKKILNLCPDFSFVSAIHPSSIIAESSSVGAGSMVMAGAIINPCSKIGCSSIINTNSVVEHDNIIGDFVTISPSTTTGGNVRIGNCTMIGMGANILPKINIGENSIIGAGALVCHDVPDTTICYGVPARIVRKKI